MKELNVGDRIVAEDGVEYVINRITPQTSQNRLQIDAMEVSEIIRRRDVAQACIESGGTWINAAADCVGA